MRLSTPPTHVLSLTEQIYCFEICANEFAYNLISIAAENKIILLLVRFPEESEADIFEYERLKNLYHPGRCHAICFAPETSLVVVPKVVTLCTAGDDFTMRIFRTDLKNDYEVQELKGHTSYINDIAWDIDGEFLASVSDDFTCKVWSSESLYEGVTTFHLKSSGMSIKWHPEESAKLMVAQKNGLIHIYNVRAQQAIMSIESPKCPLMSADWSLNNHTFVTALAGGDIFTWDLHRPCFPTDVKQVHEDGGRVVRFSPHSELVVGSIGRPDITLKVFTGKSTVPLIEAPLKLYGGLSWHHRLPYIAAASDRKLCFWKVQIK